MFIFRWLSNTLSILGIVLFALIVYFAFYPASVNETSSIRLSDVFSCEEKKVEISQADLSAASISEFADKAGITSELSLINQFINSIKPIAGKAGSTPVVEVSYCTTDIAVSDEEILNKVKSGFADKSKYYNYGTVDEFISKVNSIPFTELKFSLDKQTPTVLARSSYCNKPINKSDLFVFSSLKSDNQHIVAMFKISLRDDNNPDKFYIRNLLQTGQFIKSKLYCNGR